MKESKKWTRWRTNISLGTCSECFIRNGRIFSYEELFYMGAPRLHPNCKCYLEKLMVIDAGRATFLGTNDGLVFVTYDHYETFIEVIGEKQIYE